MLKGNIWPLVARKRPKKGFLGPRNKVLPVLWPPEAKNDSLSENTKNTNFEKNFLVYSTKRSFSASGGQKNGKWNDFWVPRIMFFFAFFGLPEAENDLLALYTNLFTIRFFVFSAGGGSILAFGGQTMQIKTYFGDPENNFFCHFLASKGQKRPFGMKYIERYFIYLCFMRWGNFFGLCC